MPEYMLLTHYINSIFRDGIDLMINLTDVGRKCEYVNIKSKSVIFLTILDKHTSTCQHRSENERIKASNTTSKFNFYYDIWCWHGEKLG